ncbi:nuclear transport factor 2 family protein [Streptomyces sp. AA1529]|uniref:nuclear transport factor 2 family protein n=1 Tax=Streptomyces sp. AA1529 TaxID=1203257 RepID=UPI0002F7E5E4|nr:nuclear transport factor 2 family protein [Streptomyces sp. AA1529]
MANFDKVRINQLSDQGLAWFAEVLRVIETLDVDAYVALMAPDIRLVMDNGALTLEGHDAVRTALAQGWQQLTGIVHDELNLYGTDHQFVHEATNTFTFADGTNTTVASTVWIDRDEHGRLAGARIYNAPQALRA